MEFAAWNTAQTRLYPRIETLPEEDRSLLWVLFGDPSTRSLIVDWDLHARQSLAEFRASTTAVRDDPLMVAMVERLRGERRVRSLVAERRRRPVRDAAASLQPPAGRPAHVRVPAALPAEWPSLTVAVRSPCPATIPPSASPSATTSFDRTAARSWSL